MNQVTALLMHFVAPGLWAATELSEADEALAVAQGQPIVRVDFTGVGDKASMMDALARDLGLPDYFGKNFDALEECLGDLNDDRRVMAIVHSSELLAADPKTVATLNEILSDSVTPTSGPGARSFIWIGADVAVPTIPNFWVSAF